NFNVFASDTVDGDFISLTASGLPVGSTFPPVVNPLVATGVFNWVNAGPIGDYVVNFSASDVDGATNQSMTISVVPGNPPSFPPLPNRSVSLGAPLNFNVVADEIFEGDTITLTASGLPPGSTFPPVVNPASATGTFNWVAAGPVGVYVVTFEASDLDGSTNVNVTITVEPDLPPVIVPVGDRVVTNFDNLVFNVAANDLLDGDTVTLSASNLPPGAVFPTLMNPVATTSTFFWAPAGPPGVYPVTFYAEDINGVTSETINITVQPGTAPTIVPLSDQFVTEAEGLVFNVVGSDPIDDDVIVLTASNLPPGATFMPVTNASMVVGTFNWASPTPTGSYMVSFYAEDRDGVDVETMTITVTPGTIPIIDPIGDQFVPVSNNLAFFVSASELIDNNLVTLTASNVPPGAVFPTNTGLGNVSALFTWNGAAPVGMYDVTFYAIDVHGVASQTVTITVQGPDSPPVITPVANQMANLGDNLTFDVFAADFADLDLVTLTASNLPPGASFPTMVDPVSVFSTFTWNNVGPVGVYPVTFYASDVDGVTTQTVFITIFADRPPVLTPIGNRLVGTGNTLTFNVTASDLPDMDVVTLSASNLPVGATFTTVANGGAVTSVFNWVGAGPPGLYSVTFFAADVDGVTNETINIQVANMLPPLMDPLPDTIGGAAGDLISFQVVGSDFADGDDVELSSVNLPPGSTFLQITNPVATTQTFTWASAVVGVYTTTFFATDIHGANSEVVIFDIGTRPSLTPISNRTAVVGSNLSFTVFATDLVDGDTVTLSASNLPPGATFPQQSGNPAVFSVFDWPITGPAGVYTSTVYAADVHGSTSETIVITITDGTRPTLLPIGDRVVTAFQPLNFDVIAEELVEGDLMSLSAVGLPPGSAFPPVIGRDSITSTFDWAVSAEWKHRQ
ncbi:MAG: hypothetical protein AAF492_06685, partial [Verrucomicrobiota bacterium]